MSELRKLTALERTFVTCMQILSELTQGYSVSFVEELVRQNGISGFFRWAQGTNRCWSALVERYGERDAHLLASFASMGNGCHYCAYGHLLAHNLHIFREREELFPLDEHELAGLMLERDPVVLETVRQRLAGPAHERSRHLIERIHMLQTGGVGQAEAEDQYLLRAIALYEWVNECSITSDEGVAPPLGPIAKQKLLRARYERARQQQRGANGKATGS